MRPIEFVHRHQHVSHELDSVYGAIEFPWIAPVKLTRGPAPDKKGVALQEMRRRHGAVSGMGIGNLSSQPQRKREQPWYNLKSLRDLSRLPRALENHVIASEHEEGGLYLLQIGYHLSLEIRFANKVDLGKPRLQLSYAA